MDSSSKIIECQNSFVNEEHYKKDQVKAEEEEEVEEEGTSSENSDHKSDV